MAETLEQRVNSPQEKKEEKKVSVLESVINETFDALKASANLSVAAAAPALGYAVTGNAGVLAASASFVAGTRGRKSSKIIRNESLSGAIFGTIAHYATLPLRYLTNLGKAAYMEVFPFFGNAAYMVGDHLVKNRSPTGLSKEFKENYWPNVKKSLYTTGPIMAAASLLLPQQFMVAAIAVANYVYRKFVIKGKGEEHTDKTPYLVAAPRVAAKFARNSVKGLYDVAHAMGSSLGDLYRKAPKLPAKSPEPAPAR